MDLIDGKIWIQRDGTEEGIAADLERAGIPKEHIVLGFRPPELRPYTGYAVASGAIACEKIHYSVGNTTLSYSNSIGHSNSMLDRAIVSPAA